MTQRAISFAWIGGPLPLLPIRSAMLKDVIDFQRRGRRTED